MCGIIAITTTNPSLEKILIDGLKIMEYRGYDSCGIAWNENNKINIKKVVGRVQNLEDLNITTNNSKCGIAHTRWATHGGVTTENAHPHVSLDNKFSLVHNGIITNYETLKKEYLEDIELTSQTDSEVIVQLLAKFKREQNLTFEDAVIKTTNLLQGSYALAIINNQTNDLIITKNKSPLLLGISPNNYLACSDINVIAKYANKFIELEDLDILKITPQGIEVVFGNNQLVECNLQQGEFNIEKNGYDHFMLKEIYEQPKVINNLVKNYLNTNNDNLIKVVEKLKTIKKIYLVASGTSYHSCLIAKDYFEKIANIAAEVYIASEFAYNLPLIAKNSGFIFISQSGETADSISCIKAIDNLAKYKLVITNANRSTMARMCDDVLDLMAGPEIAVASTKAYIAQVTMLAIVANKIKNIDITKDLQKTLKALENVLTNNSVNHIKKMVQKHLLETKSMFYLGRLYDYYVSLEAALKLKEISYINATGYAGGELKHGPIALIEKNTPVIGIVCSSDKVNAHLYSNLKEVEARGANILTISNEKNNGYDNIFIDKVPMYLSPLVSVVPTQLISYYSALFLGCDVDKPRNLAKSVTVE